MRIFKIATRPIRLDRQLAIKSINKLKWFMSEGDYFLHPEKPIGSQFTFVDKIVVKRVDGVDIEVRVNYVGKDSTTSSGMVLGGGSGVTRGTTNPAIILFLNSKLKPRTFKLYALGEKLTNSLLEVLEHELTHQVDLYSEKFDPSGSRQTLPEDGELDMHAYYNNQSEVKAYMRSVFDDIETYLPSASKVFTVQQVMKGLSGGSTTWNQISPYLTEGNKKLILKGVYQAVQDWYDQHKVNKNEDI